MAETSDPQTVDAPTDVPTAAGAPAPAARRRRGSLRRRLPLVISVLLVATVMALGAAAYWEVEAAVLQAAQERLQGAARQLAGLLAQSTTQRMEETRKLAAQPVFRAAIDTGDAAALQAAKAPLEALLAAQTQLLHMELWRGAQRILEVRSAGWPAHRPAVPPEDVGVLPLQAVGDLLYSELVVRVPRASAGAKDAKPVQGADGYLVFRRRAATPNTADAMKKLMGGEMGIRVGSRKGNVWTDLSARVPAPPKVAAAGVVTFKGLDGKPWIGTESLIAGVPWTVWMETPRATALAPVQAFWRRLARVGGAIVFAGTLLVWGISRRITAPLHALTSAAEAIAAGELDRRVRADRRDEVGRLGDAFNRMADRVQDGYTRLDAGIQARTQELEQTLAALEDAQEQLVRREKLAMLGQLASGVGHELRNPLGVMTNAVYYLEMVQPDAEPDVREYHGILRSQIGLAERIVSDLLDFSRLKPPRREDVALAGLVEAQVARLTSVPNVTVTCTVGPDLPTARIDPVQVGQVLFNLLVNALQVLEERGGTVTVSATQDEDVLALHVEDDGPGVPPQLRAKIFEPLFTTKARGIGLGLAVSRSLAEANGGELSLSEGAAGGARFTLTMPVASAQEAAA